MNEINACYNLSIFYIKVLPLLWYTMVQLMVSVISGETCISILPLSMLVEIPAHFIARGQL